ncbi:MAG: amidase family protein, partial [Saprospiraceae bacterium]
MSSRRRFIHHSILAAAGINTLLLSRCKDLTVQSKSEVTDVFDLDEVTIESLQKMYSAGSTSAEKVTQAYLERIAAIDQAGIKLNAIIEINPDALLIAKALDAERKAGTIRGPLHGIPILINDNLNTADKMMTPAG